MLEALVPSRIRRALFEYILAHPTDRFYLRGLAKILDLSVSPLRREIKRLEGSGLLSAVEEGNMRFYTVNAASPLFRQLTSSPQESASPTHPPTPQSPVLTTPPQPGAGVVYGSAPIPIGVIRARPAAPFWRAPISAPVLVGVGALGIVIVFIVAGVVALSMTSERLVSATQRAVTISKPNVTVIAPSESSASGVMRSPRWRLIPGGFGGFSPAGAGESY